MSDTSTRLSRASDSTPSGKPQSELKVDTSCDALLKTVRSTSDPFKETFSSKGSALHHVSEAVGALASLQGAPSQLLNTGIAQIPLLDKMPGMPAAVISAAHIGTPHAHDHPPSDGFPLPSIGTTIGSGCLSVLIGGMPAARVMDMGIAPTCGGLTPYFDIQTGSSNTFIGGMRAARMGIDMTRHCNPMGHAGKSGEEAEGAAEKGEEAAGEAAEVSSRARWLGRAGKAWKVGNAAVGPASGGLSAADDATQGEGLAAAMMAAQTAADAAMMLLGNLMGKDPGIEPSMGMLVDGNPTVLIGGFPMPDSQMIWHGIKHGIGKKVEPKLPKRLQELKCEFRGEPINPVTGDVRNDFTDYETEEIVRFEWGRHYSSGWHERGGALGYGFRHAWQHELRLLRTRAVYTAPRGSEYTFDRRSDGTYGGYCQGYEIEQIDGRRFIVRHAVEGDAHFELTDAACRSAICVGYDCRGARSTLHWDEQGCLREISQADASGHIRRSVEFGYDRGSRIVEVLLINVDGQFNRIARYGYDATGCLVSYRDALDAVQTYHYDAQRRVVRLTDGNGYSFFYRYDIDGRCVESTGQDGMWHVQFQYCPRRTFVTEGDGGKWVVVFNEVGTITRVVDPYGGSAEYVLGLDGRIVEEIDSGGRSLRWLYDERGRNTARADRWRNLWPPKDDAPVLPNPLRHSVPGTPSALQWGDASQVSLGDSLLLPHEIAAVAAAVFAHDAPFGEAAQRRDAAGLVIERTDELGRTERLRRDAGGNIVGRCDMDGRHYTYAMTSWNLLATETDPTGSTIRYRYTPKRKIAALVDANGNESAYTYDLKDRMTSVTRHGKLRETYVYDAGDSLIEKRDGAGKLLLSFDVGESGLYRKRVLSTGETHTYEYDARGNFTSASTDGFDVALTYDARDRRISDKRDGLGVEHAYVNGRLSSTAYFGRFVVRYEAGADGETVIYPPTGGMQRITRTSDRKLLLRLGNGTNAVTGFDVDGRCTGRIVWRDGRTHAERCDACQYSAAGELRRVTDQSGTIIEFAYDDAHRLVGEMRDGWPVRSFDYDRGGNLVSTPAVRWMRYGEGNRLAAASSGTFRYNDRNHLAEEISGDGSRTNYYYNSMDLLVKVTWSDRQEIWTAEYDGLCRRIAKAMGAVRKEYYWDGDRLAAESDPDGRLRIYVYPNETSYLPFMFVDYTGCDAEPESGQAYYVFSNQAGLPQWVEDKTGGEVWSAKEIDPYGLICVASGNAIEYDLRWPGHWFDDETGLHYNRFRSYSPTLGRYLQSDPRGQAGGINLYAYAANPLVFVDVLGLRPHSGTGAGNQTFDASAPDKAGARREAIELALREFEEEHSDPDVWLSDEDWLRKEDLYEARDRFSADKAIPCFAAGTPVLGADGLKRIEDIAVGESVVTWNGDIKSRFLRRVTAVHRNHTRTWIAVRVGDIFIYSTKSHRFWVEGLQEWIEARYLAGGMKLLTASGVLIEIQGVSVINVEKDVTYNISVDGNHNYFVHNASVLVHNSDPLPEGKIYVGVEKIGVDQEGRDVYGRIIYVGQTKQTLEERERQHRYEGEKNPDKAWKKDMKLVQYPGLDGLTDDEMDYHERKIYDKLQSEGIDLSRQNVPLVDKKLADLLKKYCG